MALAWVVVAILLAISEVVSLAFYAAFLAGGALAAALAAALGLDVVVQAIVFVLVSGLGVVFLRPMVMRRRAPALVSGAPAMVGQTAVVVDPIKDAHSAGHVKIRGENWLAISATGEAIRKGATVTVLEIRGTTLVVHE